MGAISDFFRNYVAWLTIPEITLIDILEIVMVSLHLGLLQQIIANQLLKASIAGIGTAEMLLEGTIESTLEAILSGIGTAGDVCFFQFRKMLLLILCEYRMKSDHSSIECVFDVSKIPLDVERADVLQIIDIEYPFFHPVK